MDEFLSFTQLIKTLRAQGGCPWDIEQTFQSLKPYIIEEAYELYDALANENTPALKEELGDVLLHIVMISTMAEEKQLFSITDVINSIHEKMVFRHPHVFGDKQVSSSNDVKKNWDMLKEKEKPTEGTMDSIPSSLPALLQSYKIQKRAAKQGFDWTSDEEPFNKILEEIHEFKEEVQINNEKNMVSEAGDILFSLVNFLRKHNINPEFALKESNETFLNRYNHMEKQAKNDNIIFKDLSLTKKEELWKQAKRSLS